MRRVTEYFQSKNVSQSYLKTLIESSKKDKDFDFDYHMGSIADSLLYTPELFDVTYHVSNNTMSVPDTLRDILVQVYEESHADDLANVEALICAKAKIENYMSNIKTDEKLLSNLLDVKKGREYYESLLKAKGKKVISSFEFGTAKKVTAAFESILTPMGREWDEVLFQEPVYFNYEALNGDLVQCKGLLDVLLKNNTKKILKFIDTKVTEVALPEYKPHALRLRYEFQAAFYRAALRSKYGNEWKIELPELLVYGMREEKTKRFQFSEVDLMVGQYGAKTFNQWAIKRPLSSGKITIDKSFEIKGFDDALLVHLESINANTTSSYFDSPGNDVDKTGFFK